MAAELTPYGAELAEKVADYLVQKGAICYAHRDYCGVGFCFRGGEYLYDYVQDGGFNGPWYPSTPSPIKRFHDRAGFVTWLAEQSDASLSGREEPEAFLRNNQRITRKRLEKHVAEFEGN